MMKRMGYDITKGSGLNFGKGKRAILRSFLPEGKDPDYYHKTRRGLGYVSTPISSNFESEEEVNMITYRQHRYGTQMLASAISSKVSQ